MAVYTQLTDAHIAELIARDYDLGTLASAEGILQGVENTNYKIATRQDGVARSFILTVYEKRMNPAELPFFLELMQHLARRGIACPQPIVRRDGRLFSEIMGKPIALVSFLQGKSRTEYDASQVAAVGTTLGALHLAGRDFTGHRPNALSLEGWLWLYEKLRGKLDSITPGLEALVVTELAYLDKNMPALQVPQGVIHADLFPDNVFFEGERLSGVIDFYFACNDALAYDIAVTMNAWCFEPDGSFNPEKADALVTNYQQLRPLTPPERAAFPILLRGATMRFLLTRAYDWVNHPPGALVTPHDPKEYIRKLQFHQTLLDAKEYGI